jgi:hypothetical protein
MTKQLNDDIQADTPSGALALLDSCPSREREAHQHEMQHKDSPTWCVHCGTFDLYASGKCNAPRARSFDRAIPKNRRRVFNDVFGYERAV